MKKFLAVVVAMIIAVGMTGCTDNTEELQALRDRVTVLETEVESLTRETNKISEKTMGIIEDLIEEDAKDDYEPQNDVQQVVPEANFTPPAVNESQNVDITLLSYLDKQVHSDNIDDLYAVAECDYAEEIHLKAVARRCAALGSSYPSTAESLAIKISNNSATNDVVMKELLESMHTDVWFVVASSEKVSVNTLLYAAEKCASLGESYPNTAESLAKKIEANSATTDDVMFKLLQSTHTSVWRVVASSEKSGRKSLNYVAKKCASLGESYPNTAENLAKRISENPGTTDNVMRVLTDSNHTNVWEVVATSNKSGKRALTAVAKKCASLGTDYPHTAENLAKKIASNPAATSDVMKELVNSCHPEVVSIGHSKIENSI